MFHLLEKLRTKPRSQRTFIAFSISLFFTGSMFVVWLVAEKRTPSVLAEVENVTVEENTPTDTLMRNMVNAWSGVRGTLQNAQSVIKNSNFSSTVEYHSGTSTDTDVSTTTPEY